MTRNCRYVHSSHISVRSVSLLHGGGGVVSSYGTFSRFESDKENEKQRTSGSAIRWCRPYRTDKQRGLGYGSEAGQRGHGVFFWPCSRSSGKFRANVSHLFPQLYGLSKQGLQNPPFDQRPAPGTFDFKVRPGTIFAFRAFHV